MKKIPSDYLLPSAAYTVSTRLIKYYEYRDKIPEIGDVVYGKIVRLGQHTDLENKQGRIHKINDGSKAVFVFGNRYAPDYYEGQVPENMPVEIDLLARSGIVGRVYAKNTHVKDPTRVKILGYVVDADSNIVNTRNYSLIHPKALEKKPRRARLILVVGTSMNSGKSVSAMACCWALSSMGYNVRASKITGTASLKDILHMQDAGARIVSDFSYFGYPSTYLLPEQELIHIFNALDLKYACNPENFWVVEIADGIFQRETEILLRCQEVRSRIHRLIFAAIDAAGAIGGVSTLRASFHLVPDAISGIISSSPLGIRELSRNVQIPVFDNLKPDLKQMSEILL